MQYYCADGKLLETAQRCQPQMPLVAVPAPSLKRWYKSRNQYLIMFDISLCAGVITPTRSKYFTCYNNFIIRSLPPPPAYSICNYLLLCEMSLMITDIIGIIYTIRDVCEHFMRPMFANVHSTYKHYKHCEQRWWKAVLDDISEIDVDLQLVYKGGSNKNDKATDKMKPSK